MGDAFQCDDCGEFHEGGIHNQIKVSGLGLPVGRSLELCNDCTRDRVGDLLPFEGGDA